MICGTCDLPAKALFLYLKQHNSTFGCPKCKIRSSRINYVSVYPYKKKLKLRTTEDTINTALKIKKKSIEGVKGLSYLSKIVYNYIETTSVDVIVYLLIWGEN